MTQVTAITTQQSNDIFCTVTLGDNQALSCEAAKRRKLFIDNNENRWQAHVSTGMMLAPYPHSKAMLRITYTVRRLCP